MSQIDEVVTTLDDYARAYCAKDIDALMQVFDLSGQISVIGTGKDELCAGEDEVRQLFLRNFAEATVTKFEWLWSDVVIFNDQALIAQSLIIHLDTQQGQIEVPIRWSVVLKKTDRWLWLHRHASTPSEAQTEGSAYPSTSLLTGQGSAF